MVFVGHIIFTVSLILATLILLKAFLNWPREVSLEMIVKICQKFASVSASLSDLHTAAICVTAYAGFLRFNEACAHDRGQDSLIQAD